ncbi:YopT-type cysteine protease domain-containing protein [Pseudomonas sp. Q11]|uniref:YopT-type cysteine protease domain-containing protein n=1 Tax=Pseudomonas sp. Q11 TaxID=2968470 RepID=UPI00210DC3D2|nr:YopT-type cysteine protease domain-containing protein [Pseudomonas sp. Q11]MCQ6257408.1 YopT-type cysteine protease domain-containing protein [Pseudomonas sp. Q11]
MFTFPRAHQSRRWEGQGALFGGGIPWYGGEGLGVCFGFSTLWAKIGAPFDCFATLRARKEDVSRTQEMLSESMTLGELVAMGSTADAVIGRDSIKETAYADGVASHIVLDVLQRTGARHFIISFYFVGGPQGRGAHAIAASFDEGQTGRLFDPNYGVGAYQSRTHLCNDLHALLASYVVPGGHVTESYLLEFDHEDAFGEFQGAAPH